MSSFANHASPNVTPPPANDLSQYAGPWGREQVTHLLKRTMFGAKKADVDYFVGKGRILSVLELLNDKSSPGFPLNYYESDKVDTVPLGQTWVNEPRSATTEGYRLESYKYWWIGLMINQKRSIREKMVLFLSNLLATEDNEIGYARYAYKYNKLLRDNYLGNYKSLVKSITLEPKMLIYLNGKLNKKASPDENYGRELQELFTVGKGSGSGYTENDVKAAAKVLTGYSDDINTANYIFTSSNHDTTNKQFSSFYGNKIITGKTGASGQEELDDLMDMIFSTDEVSKYICRRIYNFFVYYDITPEIETNIITPLAAKFKASGYSLKTVMDTLLNSNHFYNKSIMGCVLKSPLDLIIGSAREFEFIFPSSSLTDIKNQYLSWKNLYTLAGNMLQSLGNPPNVAGWPAYYQAPQYHEIWINSDSYPKRNTFTNTIANGNGYPYGTYKVGVNILNYIKGFKTPSDPNKLIVELVERIYVRPLSQTSINSLKTLLIGTQSDSYWTLIWNDYLANPTNTDKANLVKNKLIALLQNMMKYAEYHLS